MRKPMIAGLIFTVALLAACGKDPAGEAARDPSGAQTALPTSVSDARTRPDPRTAPVPLVNGKPMWSANRDRTAEENAQAAFERNGVAFGTRTRAEFVARAHAFIDHPPAGVQRISRANGDTLLYDPAGNIFAVATKDGAPRTMFKPDDGAAYWAQQKEREAKRSSQPGTRPKRDRDAG